MNDTKFLFKKKDDKLEFEELRKEMMKIINDKFESLNNRISANENVMIKQVVDLRHDFTKSENEREHYNWNWALHFATTIKKIEKKLDFHKTLLDEDNERIEDLENYYESIYNASDHSEDDKVNIDSASDHSDAETVKQSSDDEEYHKKPFYQAKI